jgi:hypothetical protein
MQNILKECSQLYKKIYIDKFEYVKKKKGCDKELKI